MPRAILVHGTATTGRMWDPLLPFLADWDLEAPDRPKTGSLAAEVAWLAERCQGRWVIGVSGGATLAMALAGSGASFSGAVLHEPAVGSLVPGLLAPVAAAFASGGTAALGQTLYGATWEPGMSGGQDDATTAGELAMFRGFEPTPLVAGHPPITLTVGERSPVVRHQAATRLAALTGLDVLPVPGAHHFAPHDAPAAFATVVRSVVRSVIERHGPA
jgi:pimeloyl-ACP methyl ester carboxylesterase